VLAQLIQRDMALASQVMRVANSAVYARRNPVVTLPQAVAWLGIREIRNIAFAVALKGQVFSSAYFRGVVTDLWRESVITALFAQEIARLKRRNVESAYLCGLLHRVGMAVILNRVGTAVLERRLTPDVAHVVQIAARHEARVGTLLSIAWQLPPAVAAAISHWGDPPAAELSRTEVMEVALARQISDEMRTPGAGGELPDSMLGPVSRWMDELSIYPDELFSIMAQRAAIYATAESFL
jgi:HD-like signal output (HDOD) protein